MKNSTQKRIADAYAACYQLCSQRGAVRAQAYLKKALDASRRGEAEHRKAGARFTRSAARYKLPIADAARFFAVKWFLDETPGPEDYTAAACLREDALNALAARDEVRREIGEREWRELRAEFLDVLELDYCKVFAA